MSETSKETGKGLSDWLRWQIPKMVVAPTFALIVFFVYGFIAWTGYVSLTKSRMLPNYSFEGFYQYIRLWKISTWSVAMENLLIFGGLFIGISIVLGCLLAVALDQKIRAEGALRTVYLYPMAISLIVTGTAWKWILNPGLGLERLVQSWGWESFEFNWLISNELAIYTLVIAAVWQSSGFVMALFLAALRGVDSEIIKAAYLDGASLSRIYLVIILPTLRPVFLSSLFILAHMAVKSFDLVVALTGGGPGNSSILPANFMYEMTFRRNQLGLGAASAMMMLATVMAIVIPYLYSELRERKNG
ncbi:carbohydrate ABC transporter permease [Kiloniella sp. b19]|uniref:carbohydrate ABC transporter permease n=1 Tax=Kiloniella sp. GXU_MW_B19 TaxID=3141326 RepID=UPI0031E14270